MPSFLGVLLELGADHVLALDDQTAFAALAFGAIFPTLVAWFIVLPLKGLPVSSGFTPGGIITALSVNGAWGLGTALLLRWFSS